MLAHAREALALTAGHTIDSFHADRKLILAAERLLEIIGEAARHVPPAITAQIPSVIWEDVIGMRNIIAHDYHSVSYALVFTTIRDYIPELVNAIEAAMPTLQEPPR
jgi:uncharacterized protein with HEPN domain